MCPKSVSLMFQILAEQETARFLPFRNFRLIVTTLYNCPTLETKNYTIKKMKKYESTIRLPSCSAQPTWPWWCSRPQEWWALPIQPIAQVSAPPQPPLPTSSDLGLTEKEIIHPLELIATPTTIVQCHHPTQNSSKISPKKLVSNVFFKAAVQGQHLASVSALKSAHPMNKNKWKISQGDVRFLMKVGQQKD